MLRNLLLGALCLCWAVTAMAQTNFYYADGGKMSLSPVSNQFIVTADDASTLTSIAPNNVKTYQSWAHKPYSVVRTSASATSAEVIQLLGFDTDEVQVSPGFALSDGYVLYPTRTILAQLHDKADAPAMQQLLGQYGVKDIVKKYGVYRIELRQLDQVFSAANALQESGLVAFAQPDFYAPIERYQTTDPLFPQQFQMNNTGQTLDGVTGQADADCNALEAWGISLGSSSITVAVIDDGMEAHEDFVTSGGASRYTAGFSPANNGNGDAISGSNHGVACAGSIAASHNGIGVMGVAPLVNLISVNIFVGGESTQDIADGITWAKNQGADVMSNSWGYTSCTASFSNINNAMADANANGRGGKGSVLVFASGNGYKDCVDFPANNANVIAVGAFANTGVRSAYSNYGPALDIMAPSNNVGGPGAGVRTTDRMGGPGYTSGNYTSSFGGTSSACPVVSGVAALVLGYNPDLTSSQLKDVLYNTAIDMGPAGDDLEYANGRVDAFGALQAAGDGGGGGPTCTDGIQNGDETGIDCGGSSCPACPPPPPPGCNNTEVVLSITFDNYPEETSWVLTNDAGQTVASGGTYGAQADGSTLTIDLCLVDDCYTFTMQDSYGDGMCCTYGNGSYTLTQGGTTLASGSTFGSTDANDFCIGGTGADTTPPSTPTNLSASNETDTTVDLNWSASTDNVGVTGYNVYQGTSLLGSVTGTSATVTGLTACSNYTFSVSAIDAAGNESGQATTNASTTGCTTTDTTPPSVPTNLAANNETETTVDLNWNASSDNVGVTGYNVYLDGSFIGNVSGTSATVTELTACTSYNFSVSATDAAGNESGQASTSASTTGCSGGGGELGAYYFETGLQGWADGGGDCFRANDTRSYEGSYSIRLRDNSGVASSMTSPAFDLAGLASVNITFYFYASSMENGEDFFVRYNDGSGWQTIAAYARGSSFNNNTFYQVDLTLTAGTFNLTNGARFRIQCDASNNNDQIYVDEVVVTGATTTTADATAGAISVIRETGKLTRSFGPELGEAEFLVTPNPASDFVQITADEAIEEVSVFSIEGRLLLHRTVEGLERTTVDVSTLPTGVYLLSVQTEEEVANERIVIRR